MKVCIAFLVLAAMVLCACVKTSTPVESNPFQVGQVVVAKPGLESGFIDPEVIYKDARVVDIADQLVMVEFNDRSQGTYSWKWFQGRPVELSTHWLVGNQFHIGQEVCAVPASVRETFPDRGKITWVEGDLLWLDDWDSFIAFEHFQPCR